MEPRLIMYADPNLPIIGWSPKHAAWLIMSHDEDGWYADEDIWEDGVLKGEEVHPTYFVPLQWSIDHGGDVPPTIPPGIMKA